MAWTYVLANLSANGKDTVRFLIQDIQVGRPLCADEEIAWALASESNIYMAAALCCDILVARAGNVESRWIGDLRVTYDPQFYRGLAMLLRTRGVSHQIPYAGGISISDKMEQQQDTDATQPRAFRTLLDSPRAEQPSPGGDQANPLTGI
jgi:hypothetical protein